MSRHRFSDTARTAITTLVFALAAGAASAQAIQRPQPTCVRNVTLDRSNGEDAEKITLLLKDGRIESVLAADAPTPQGMRIIDGEGLIALPAFLDAYTRKGCETPDPVAEQDMPVDVESDVRVDMRLANRKGIQPAFRSVDALAIEAKDAEAWRESGFGAALVAPGGQLLAGTSALVTTREAAMRDLVVTADVFACAEFNASGRGYPSTLMGHIAQLRQFFLDTQRHAELGQRYEQGRPGTRPPFDDELEAGMAILAGERIVLSQAESHRDIERWIKLADDFGFGLAISGGRDAWRVAETLAERDIPVLLTLDWGKEVDDPTEKKKKGKKEGEPEEEGEPDEEGEAEEAEGAEGAEEVDEGEIDEEEPAADEESEESEIAWEYEEPLAVRVERRRLWEEKRDGAIRLQEAGVRIAFGSKSAKPKELLENVRSLVEAGLSEEAALAGLTTNASAMLGVEDRLGSIAPGYDATLTLWTADPLTDDKAKAIWTFVDGFPTEFERPKDKDKKEGDGAGPAEGVDAGGSWTLLTESEEEMRESQLTLEMDEDGSVTGTLVQESPFDQSEQEIELTGFVSGSVLTLTGTLEIGDFSIDLEYELTIEGDSLAGDVTLTMAGRPEPMVRTVEGERDPA